MSTTVSYTTKNDTVSSTLVMTTTVTTTTEIPYCKVSDETVLDLLPNISLYLVNIIVGSVCLFTVCLSFIVLVSSKKFRQQYAVIIVLCVAEMFAELGIILEATTRRELFANAIETRKASVRSSRECLEPWVLCQTIGDFFCPSIEFLMGLERMCAVSFPSIFRTVFSPNTEKFLVLTTLIAAALVITPTAITVIWPTPNVRWSCGRKAAFGKSFGLIDYTYNVIGFTSAFCFNLVALYKAVKTKQSGRNMAKLKCYTAIAFLSTLLISIPNLLSILNVFISIPDELMTPTPILACANGAVQFLVYLSFNPEFRQRFSELVTFNHPDMIVKVKPLSNFTQVPTSSARISLSTVSKVTVLSKRS